MKKSLSKNISVIIQGAIANETASCLKNIRKLMPEAEIILSTWEGSSTAELEGLFDKLVLNKDPGALNDEYFPDNPYNLHKQNNRNRQICSTKHGLEKAERKYALKIRTDFILTNTKFIEDYFEIIKISPQKDKNWQIFEERILTIGTGNPDKMGLAYHLSDLIAFGLTKDIKKLWDIPYLTKEDATYCLDRNINDNIHYFSYKYATEQQLLLDNLDKNKIQYKKPEYYFDIDEEIKKDSEKALINNFIFYDYIFSGIITKFKGMERFDNGFHYTFEDYLILYEKHFGQNTKTKKYLKKYLSKTRNISVVVQGPVSSETKLSLKSIRKYLPESEIILSTWIGENTDGLEYDKLILNEDPGSETMDINNSVNYNLNRQLLSSKKGIEEASRKYILKIRSDIILENAGFFKYFNKFPKRNWTYAIFSHKVLTSSLYTIWAELGIKKEKGKIHPTPFHISDWWYFGLASDINLLYSCSLVDIKAFAQYFETPYYNLEWLNHRLWKFPPEQYMGVELAKKKFPDLNFRDCLSYSNVDNELSRHFITDNFISLDSKQSGLVVIKSGYKKMCKKFWHIPPHVFFSMYDYLTYTKLYYQYYKKNLFLEFLVSSIITLKNLYYRHRNKRIL